MDSRLRQFSFSLLSASCLLISGCGDEVRNERTESGGSAGKHAPATGAGSIPNPVVLAEEMTRAFADDKEAANRQYGALTEVTLRGSVIEVLRVEGMEITHVMLKGHRSADGEHQIVQRTLEDPFGAQNVMPGDTVTINGQSSGQILGRIMIFDCKIVE